MPRGYRSIILAAVGWLILANAQEPAKHAETKNGGAQQSAATAPAPAPTEPTKPAYRAYSDRDSEACYNADDHDSADLCAQWRAAAAAEKAAHEARRATNWSIIATVLSALTLGGLIFSLLQTNGALGEARKGNKLSMRENVRATMRSIASAKDTAEAIQVAKRNADAAGRIADLAEHNSKLQLRAYIAPIEARCDFATGAAISGYVRFCNHGATPAKEVRVTVVTWITAPPISDPEREGGPVPVWRVNFKAVLTATGSDKAVWYSDSPEDVARLMADQRNLSLYLYGNLTYQDIFGEAHETRFAYRSQSGDPKGEDWLIHCAGGNEAT